MNLTKLPRELLCEIIAKQNSLEYFNLDEALHHKMLLEEHLKNLYVREFQKIFDFGTNQNDFNQNIKQISIERKYFSNEEDDDGKDEKKDTFAIHFYNLTFGFLVYDLEKEGKNVNLIHDGNFSIPNIDIPKYLIKNGEKIYKFLEKLLQNRRSLNVVFHKIDD
jgi:hypothetical protein